LAKSWIWLGRRVEGSMECWRRVSAKSSGMMASGYAGGGLREGSEYESPGLMWAVGV
jgi:hypothetical protein